MTEFMHVLPGEARHKDGWSVYFRGRWLVVYELGAEIGEMEIEHGPDSDTIYPDSFHWTMPEQRDVTVDERDLITSRIVDAMRFMSSKGVEVHAGRA